MRLVKALDFVQIEMDSFMLVWRGVFRFVSKCKWVRIDQDPGPKDLERMPSDLTREVPKVRRSVEFCVDLSGRGYDGVLLGCGGR